MDSFPIELLDDRIAITRDDRSSMTRGGLALPPSAQPRSMTGTVVAVGPGLLRGDNSRAPMPVKPGDRVLFEQFRAMIPVDVGEERYYILRVHDILGVVSNQEADVRPVAVQ